MSLKDYITITLSTIALLISGLSFYLAQSKHNDFRAAISNPSWNFHSADEGQRHPTLEVEADMSFINVGELPVIVTNTILIASAYGPNDHLPPLQDCAKGAIGGDHGNWNIPALALKPGEVKTKRVKFEPIRFMTINYAPDSTNDTTVIVCSEYSLIDSEGNQHRVRAPVLSIFGNAGTHPNEVPALLGGQSVSSE